MRKYKVELAEFRYIEVEAENRKDAEEKVAVMDDESIRKESFGETGMVIWDVSVV